MTGWLGIDVGGANLKVADGSEFAHHQPFALWQRPDELAEALTGLLQQSPACEAICATMTGELADCYETKRDGVLHITNALSEAAGDRRLVIYAVDGSFQSSASTFINPLRAAASNWHALARFASRFLPNSTGLVIDIGSTTADIIPVIAGEVASQSQTDFDRLVAGELVYTGASRTPVATIVSSLPYRGLQVPVAAEFFSTTGDVQAILGYPLPDDAESADGRGFSQQECIDRLARQICVDRESFNLEDAITACQYILPHQLFPLEMAALRVLRSFPSGEVPVIISGSGESLARQLVARLPRTTLVGSLGEQIGEVPSSCAAAVAVARLAMEQFS
ncbi:hydantoinase/oxoprolinase family protein [Aeoliella mucimassa]|uniref:Hydantoinase/oxoprolinase n=1 Tax=Aeoliella mucimassa TaxID=2527972 RepID=A0A518AP76_9BACT|nr:hydantoinase/oxoprolinase family protein [Aeoliella mucimassa]QDU56501.1 Hydantoinase/oxoprolinase [Aeoliella mucimassa]